MDREFNMNQGKQKEAFGYLLITFFFFGSTYVAGKLIANAIPPAFVAAIRCILALVPLGLMSKKYWHLTIDHQDKKMLFFIGFLAYFLNIHLIQLGIKLTGASVAALVNSLTPVAVIFFAALILHEKITPLNCLCLVLAVAGTAVITGTANGQGEIYGIIAVLGGVCSFSAASVFMRSLTSKYPPILVTFYGMLVGAVLNIPVTVYMVATVPVVINPLLIGTLLWLSFVGAGLAQFTWAKCLSMLPASTCSLFYPLQAVFAAILGALILGEKFTTSFFVGLLLISADIIISTRETAKGTKK